MAENITVVVLVTIDTSNRIGPTCVYGEHEIANIIKEGAKVRGYTATVANSANEIKLEKGTRIGLITTISSKEG